MWRRHLVAFGVSCHGFHELNSTQKFLLLTLQFENRRSGELQRYIRLEYIYPNVYTIRFTTTIWDLFFFIRD